MWHATYQQTAFIVLLKDTFAIFTTKWCSHRSAHSWSELLIIGFFVQSCSTGDKWPFKRCCWLLSMIEQVMQLPAYAVW